MESNIPKGLEDILKQQQQIQKDLQPFINSMKPTIELAKNFTNVSNIIKENIYPNNYKYLFESVSKTMKPVIPSINEALRIAELLPSFKIDVTELDLNIPKINIDFFSQNPPKNYINNDDVKDTIANLKKLSEKEVFTTEEKEKLINAYTSFSYSVSYISDNNAAYNKTDIIDNNEPSNNVEDVENKQNYLTQKIPSMTDPDFYFQTIAGILLSWIAEYLRFTITNDFDPTSFLFVFGVTVTLLRNKK